MPFRRAQEQRREMTQLVASLYASFVASSASLKEFNKHRADGPSVAELRGPALDCARRAAHLNRGGFKAVMYLGLREELPPEWLPLGALGAFARVIYGLAAIAEDPPEPQALLGADELAGLGRQYSIEDWLHFWRSKTTPRAGHLPPPAPGDEPEEPSPDARLMLRQRLLAEPDLGEEFEADARFLIARQEAAAGLLLDHAELLGLARERYADDGPSPRLEAIALQAAGNLATVLQPLRRRQDLLNLLIEDPDVPAVPMALIDQMLFSFLLLTGPRNERYLTSVLPIDEIDGFMGSRAVREWMTRLDPLELFEIAPGARLGLG
jgi:hypothetical protein